MHRFYHLLILLLVLVPIRSLGVTAGVEEAKSIARLYSAAFDRNPEITGLNFWVNAYESGKSITHIAGDFLESPEFVVRHGQLTDNEYVRLLYINVLGRDGAQEGIDFWIGVLASDRSRANVLERFADSPENIEKTSETFANMHLTDSVWSFDESTPEIAIGPVQDMGPVETSETITMRDCGFSTVFQGRSVWIFGDSMLKYPNIDNIMMLSNSWCTSHDTDAGDGLYGFEETSDAVAAPTLFFPFTDAEQEFNRKHKWPYCEEKPCPARWAIWPGSMVVDEEKDWAYIFYHKVYAEEGDWNFSHVGHSIAVWKDYLKPVERPVFGYYDLYPTLFFVEDRNGFGSANLVVDKLLYIYGCEFLSENFSKDCRIARVPIADILDRTAWRFFSGNGVWSPELSTAVDIFSGSNMMSVFYNPYIERYLAVYSGSMGVDIELRTASQPEGPWSSPIIVITGERPNTELGWIYDALAHPELSQDNGRIIYITYSRQLEPGMSEMRLVSVQLERPN